MRSRKKEIAYALAALLTAAVGCGGQADLPIQNQESGENLVTEPMVEGEVQMENQSRVRGKTMEAQEPEKAKIKAEDYESWNRLLDEHEVSESFQEGLNQFAYQSGSAVLKDTQGNENYSPLSLYYTLALAGCGSEGETADQILKNLGVEDQKELAEQCRKLYQWYAYQGQRNQERARYYGLGDYQSVVRLGNSLWISDQLSIREEYQKMAAEQFFASSYCVDFKNPDTGIQMGEWIARKTNDVLQPQLNPGSETVLSILNTLYFYGSWMEPFDEEMTQEDIFTLEDEEQVTIPYLNRTEMMGSFKKGNGYTLSFLSTSNDCRMVFLLPEEGRNIEEFLETPDKLKAVMEVEEWTQGKVTWKVPKFHFGSSYRLEDTLKVMGMERMFDSSAEFEGISWEPLFVSSVIQETHIAVDEQGVEGAAYTEMAMAMGGILDYKETAEMILDHPFLFGIQDAVHGTWLFLGVCRNPA